MPSKKDLQQSCKHQKEPVMTERNQIMNYKEPMSNNQAVKQ